MENKSENMGKGFGFVAIILIWGGLLYLLFNGSLLSDFSGSKLLGSVSSSFNGRLDEQKGIISIFNDNEENFQEAKIHFNKSVDISVIYVYCVL